ncbi:hypothetical protein Micbo1qcDRAFT_162214, partial [Microdochium bolleyi]
MLSPIARGRSKASHMAALAKRLSSAFLHRWEHWSSAVWLVSDDWVAVSVDDVRCEAEVAPLMSANAWADEEDQSHTWTSPHGNIQTEPGWTF